jgi:hypothetical protein
LISNLCNDCATSLASPLTKYSSMIGLMSLSKFSIKPNSVDFDSVAEFDDSAIYFALA